MAPIPIVSSQTRKALVLEFSTGVRSAARQVGPSLGERASLSRLEA